MKKGTGACDRNRDLVLKMAKSGAYLTEIGRAVGTTKNRVKEFLVRNGADRHFPTTKKGPEACHWKGGGTEGHGYKLLYLPNHPHARGGIYYAEHRFVMEGMIGRMLRREEVVHHRNGDKSDNRPENLELFQNNAEHLRKTLKGKVPKWTPQGIENIRKGIRRSVETKRARSLQASKLGAQMSL